MISSIQEPNELRKRLQGFYRTDEKSYIRYLVEKAELSADSKIEFIILQNKLLKNQTQ